MRLRTLLARQWFGVAALAALLVAPRPIPAQDAVFHAESSLLELEVRATDARGRALDSLLKGDFSVYENGEPREIAGFEYVPEAGRRGVSGELRPQQVHRVLVLFDVAPEQIPRALPFVERFVRERLPEGLLTSINGLAFTTDKAALLRALRDRSWTSEALASAGASMIDPVLADIGVGEVDDYSANLVEDQFGRAKLYRYLRLVGALAQYPGRKSVVLFSPGFPMGYDYGSGSFVNSQDLDLMDALGGEATRGRVRFYTVTVGGLEALAAGADASASSLSPETGGSVIGAGQSLGASTNLLLQQNGLAVLANRTGGQAILNENRLGKAFEPVLRDDGGYYLISYAIPEAGRPGAERNIDVEVKRRGARLDYQRRYYDRQTFLEVVGAGPPAASPSEAFEQYRAAIAALEQSPADLDAAAAALEGALEADPGFAMAWTLMGNLRAARGEASAAREAFEEAVKADPNGADSYWGLIRLAAAEQDWARVRSEAARLLERGPGSPRGLYATALAEWNLENVETAEEAARRAAEAGGDEFPRAYRILGLALAARGEIEQAAAAFEAFLEREPDAPDAPEAREKLAEWRDAAEVERLRALAEEGRWDEAAALSARLLAEDRRATEAHFFHALAQFNLGRNELAAEHARLAAAGETAAGLPELHYLLGLLAAQGGDTATAAAEYRTYLAAKPDSEMADAIQARISEWEALERPRQPSGPASPLEELRTRMRRTLEQVPNYACAMVMERGEMAPRTGRDYAKAEARAERMRSALPAPVYDRIDRIRMDVAMIGGRELFSWPGESAFSERPLAEMIGYGAASTGDYALHAGNLFLEPQTQFQAAGSEMLDGREVERYVYAVAEAESRFAVQQGGAPALVAYDGAVWASGAELAAIELVVRAFPKDYDIEWSRTRIEYQSVELGGESFLLPRVSDVLIRFRSGARNALHTTFQDCRAYGVETAITFGVEERGETRPARGPEQILLPRGLPFSVKLISPIGSSSMTGDAVEGLLEAPLSGGWAECFPEGSRVRGRIRRLDYLTNPGPHFVVGIELTRVEADGRFASIAAEMDGVTGLAGRLEVASTVDGMRGWRNMGDGEGWKGFFRAWDGGLRSGGSLVYYERFLAGVGLLFLHGEKFELPPGVVTHWVTVGAP